MSILASFILIQAAPQCYARAIKLLYKGSMTDTINRSLAVWLWSASFQQLPMRDDFVLASTLASQHFKVRSMRASENNPPLVMNIERRYFAEILSIPRRKKVEYRQLTEYWLTRLERVGPTPFCLRLMNGMLPPVPEAIIMVEKVVKRKSSGTLELHLGKIKNVKHWDRKRERPAR